MGLLTFTGNTHLVMWGWDLNSSPHDYGQSLLTTELSFLSSFPILCMHLFRFFWVKVSLYSSSHTGTHYVDQGELLTLIESTCSTSQVLGVKECITMPGFFFFLWQSCHIASLALSLRASRVQKLKKKKLLRIEPRSLYTLSKHFITELYYTFDILLQKSFYPFFKKFYLIKILIR